MKVIGRTMLLVLFIVLLLESPKALSNQRMDNKDHNQKQLDLKHVSQSRSISTPGQSKLDFVLRNYPNQLLEDEFFPIVDK